MTEPVKRGTRPDYLHGYKLETWVRPCLRCGGKAARPKWQYICDGCTAKNNRLADVEPAIIRRNR